jgi:hypothetical protein
MTARTAHLSRQRLQDVRHNERHENVRHQTLFARDHAWQRAQAPATLRSEGSGNEAIFDTAFWVWIVLAFLLTVLGGLYLLFFAEV